MGKAYRDVVRGFRGVFERTPDMVAFPRDDEDVRRVLEMCEERRLAVIPYGGGTSVVGGVEPRVGLGYRGTVSIDLVAPRPRARGRRTSMAARIQAGTLGPALEEQLGERGFTLRHFPQSFEFSTLGGWIATRAGGHFATLETHIDDLVESVRAITPAGTWESRRLPGSGAGPSPDRMLIGSEGILGVITEAWVRVRPRPTYKLSCGIEFDDFTAGVEAVRVLSQSGLHPSNCRLLDPLEALTTEAGDGNSALLILGFESAFGPVDGPMAQALAAVRDLGGRAGEVTGAGRGGDSRGDDAVGQWRSAFLSAPYLRDSLVSLGVLSETFETAITWDRFREFHAVVTETARRSVADVVDAPATGPARRGSAVASPTSTPTARLPTSPSWRRPAAARRSSSGTRSRRPSPRRSPRPAARSPTTTPSAAITAPGTTCSDPSRSPRRWPPPRRRLIRAACSTPAC